MTSDQPKHREPTSGNHKGAEDTKGPCASDSLTGQLELAFMEKPTLDIVPNETCNIGSARTSLRDVQVLLVIQRLTHGQLQRLGDDQLGFIFARGSNSPAKFNPCRSRREVALAP